MSMLKIKFAENAVNRYTICVPGIIIVNHWKAQGVRNNKREKEKRKIVIEYDNNSIRLKASCTSLVL